MTSIPRVIVLFFIFALSLHEVALAAEYVGSEKCSECHLDLYSEWSVSGHHLQLRKAADAQHASLPLPPGYTWDDISYVVGGVKRKTLFVDQDGYIITSAKNGSKGKTQYHLEDGTWSDYLPGEKAPYNCAGCHTTGYLPDGHQDDLVGIIGTWKEEGIGCEACHGPCGDHVKNPGKMFKTDKEFVKTCENCHQRGGIDFRPLTDIGLVRHHEQINELKSGVHKALSCIDCHEPHRRSFSARDNCTICHARLYHDFKNSLHGKANIKCFECHMPKVSTPAISRTSYREEMRKHLFKINTDPKANMFQTVEEKNYQSTFTTGFITVEFACLGCHGSRDKTWAAKHAKGFHK